MTDLNVQEFATYTPQLTHLTLEWQTEATLLSPLAALTSLQHLSLTHSSGVPHTDGIFAFLTELTGLRQLSLAGFIGVETVNLHGMTGLTSLCLGHMLNLAHLTHLPNLQRLSIEVCSMLSFADIPTAALRHLTSMELRGGDREFANPAALDVFSPCVMQAMSGLQRLRFKSVSSEYALWGFNPVGQYLKSVTHLKCVL